jgi:hypothetical protein
MRWGHAPSPLCGWGYPPPLCGWGYPHPLAVASGAK